jgi:hypothetical protein
MTIKYPQKYKGGVIAECNECTKNGGIVCNGHEWGWCHVVCDGCGFHEKVTVKYCGYANAYVCYECIRKGAKK